jgi:hypothetical protein
MAMLLGTWFHKEVHTVIQSDGQSMFLPTKFTANPKKINVTA